MRWPVHIRCRRKKFTVAISSPDEFLYIFIMKALLVCLFRSTGKILVLIAPTSYTPFTRYKRLSNRLNNRLKNRLNVCLHDAAGYTTG